MLTGFAWAAAAGCGLPAPPSAARLWTLDSYAALYEGHADAEKIPPLPAATPADMLLASDGGGHYRLVLRPTFDEGYLAAYVTTDLWQGFDQIWVQPLYVQVADFSATGEPQLFPASDPRSWPIFSVGPKSRFYSPYWAVRYVKIPADSPGYRSVTDLLNDRQRLPPDRPGGARTASLFQSDLTIDAPVIDRDADPDLPTPDQVGPTLTRGQGYLDGAPINFLDFGMDQFQWDTHRVVAEVPLYELTFRDTDGSLQPFGGPKVSGFGPPFSGRLPQPYSQATQPRYGGYWRMYTVELPPQARIFAPPQFPQLRDALAGKHVPIADLGPDITGRSAAEVAKYVGRVSTSSDCFTDFAALTNCQLWLTSQEKLESELDITAFTRTNLTVTCPFVSYMGVPFHQPSPGTTAAASAP